MQPFLRLAGSDSAIHGHPKYDFRVDFSKEVATSRRMMGRTDSSSGVHSTIPNRVSREIPVSPGENSPRVWVISADVKA